MIITTKTIKCNVSSSTLTIDNIVRLRVQWTAVTLHVPDEIDAYGALIFAREMGAGESCMHAAKN